MGRYISNIQPYSTAHRFPSMAKLLIVIQLHTRMIGAWKSHPTRVAGDYTVCADSYLLVLGVIC